MLVSYKGGRHMDDFIYIMGETLMMNMDCISDIAYPRDEAETMIIKTDDAEYAVTVKKLDASAK
jgi:hypothetical protein